MKILIPFSLLLFGLAVGYAIGINTEKFEVRNEHSTDSISTNFKIIHDTIIKIEIVKVEREKYVRPQIDSLKLDSLTQYSIVLDTLKEKVIEEEQDSLSGESLNILSDTRLKIIKLPINHLTSKGIDSLLKSAIEIKDIDKQFINVEFWESPINFSGYKLSKSKLVIYGLSPQLGYELLKKDKVYYLKFHSITYELYETEDFKQFVQTLNLIE